MVGQGFVNQLHNAVHVGFAQAAGSYGRRPNADAAGHERRLVVERHHVFVDGDVGPHQRILSQLATDALRTQVNQHEVVVGAARNNVVAQAHKAGRQRLGVAGYLLGVGLEIVGERLAEGHSLGRNYVLERPALGAGEHARIEQRRHGPDFTFRGFQAEGVVEILAQHDEAAARAAQGFVGRRRHDVAVLKRRVQQARGDEGRGVRDVGQQQGPHFVGGFAQGLVVPVAGVG